MYCFPYPAAGGVDSIRVPLVARTQYLISGKKRSWKDFTATIVAELATTETTEANGFVSPWTASLAAAIQSSLFFGIASEAIGRNIKHEEFAIADLDGNHLSIDIRLPEWYWHELKARWDDLDDRLTAPEYEATRNQLLEMYNSAQSALILWDLLTEGLQDEEFAKVLLSVNMLLFLVGYVVDDSKFSYTQTANISASTKLLKRRMIKLGWCAKRLNFLEYSPMSYPTFYFLSSLKPPRIKEEDHSSCSSEKCLVSTKLTKPLHRTEDCLCEDIAVPVDEVNKILALGGIPLIRIERSENGNTELEVAAYTPGFKYVAISHVWADRQFGSVQNALPKCQVGYLQEVLSSLPTDMGWREWILSWRKSSKPGEILPSSQPFSWFWLDSFCIPQAVEHADLRSKAIDNMNLIYAAASYTLVFDKGLQSLDAGQRSASLIMYGSLTHYAPQEENLLDVVCSVYASNWMGRAWTLQEGTLSGKNVFPLNGSLAFLKLLWPYYNDGLGGVWGYWDFLITRIPRDFRRSVRDLLPYQRKPNKRQHDERTSLREIVRGELFENIKKSLVVEGYGDYARSAADRAARFVKAHSLLQSRTTTQAEDLPLILMNMCCMNANIQSKTIDARMEQLVYGLKSIPVELLFSNCARLGQCNVDSWIPREIVPERFEGNHVLKLNSAGWLFETKQGAEALRFYLLSLAEKPNRFEVQLPGGENAKAVRYNVEALQRSDHEQLALPTCMWCIAIDGGLKERAARFAITRVVGNEYFLYFDCPLSLTQKDENEALEDDQRNPGPKVSAVSLVGEFILERSHQSQDLSLSRPQNPEQNSDRLIVISQAIISILNWLERRLMRKMWGDENAMSTRFFVFYFFYLLKQRQWVEHALNMVMYRAWMATYQPDWNPHGRWGWFWKLSNWDLPFKKLMKWYCTFTFFIAFQSRNWYGVSLITCYWLPLFPKKELRDMYLTAMITMGVIALIYR